MEGNPLIGIWSADCIYGPGAQADTVFVFLPDGTGALEEWNFSLSYYDLFTWVVGADGLLTIAGIKSVIQNEAGQVVNEASLFSTEQFRFSVVEEGVPKGGIAEVLTIIRDTPKRSALAEKYGRFPEGSFAQDGSDYQLPTFYGDNTHDNDD